MENFTMQQAVGTLTNQLRLLTHKQASKMWTSWINAHNMDSSYVVDRQMKME